MKPLHCLPVVLVHLSAASVLCAQDAAPAPKAKLELKGDAAADPTMKLDPSGKLSAEGAPAEGATLHQLAEPPSTEMPEALKKLNQADRDKYATLREEVTTYMRSVRLQESLQKLAEAETLVGEPLAEIENLRGAVYTKMRDFDSARSHFQKAHELDKESFHPKFNLAELDFVQKHYAPAITAFNELIKQNESIKLAAAAKVPEEMREVQARQFETTTRLMQFKLLICHAQQKESKAEDILKSFVPFDNDSPAYYFGKAALAYAKDQKDDGDDWVASAKNIYPADVTAIFIDSLVEMGWVSTLGN